MIPPQKPPLINIFLIVYAPRNDTKNLLNLSEKYVALNTHGGR